MTTPIVDSTDSAPAASAASAPTVIHPTAVVDPAAQLGNGVIVGPYSVIGPDVSVGDGTRLASSVILEPGTAIGQNCHIGVGAVIGGLPQDLNFKGEPSGVLIGDNVTVREYVTINRATGEGQLTRVDDGAFLMAYAHLAHNCHVGREAILANAAQLGGYVTVGEYAFVSATTVVHQFVRIGRLSMVGGASGTRQDVPPFAMTDGRPVTIIGINKVGLRRRGFSAQARQSVRRAYHWLWYSPLNISDAIARLREEMPGEPLVEELIEFVQTSKRGIHRPVGGPPVQVAENWDDAVCETGALAPSAQG
ncbi:MAG: acyl-ACP--UDP-N-acetylglucosamine O-acyltransferase [Vampirovibrionales bacterium]|nr:acyl-ACP--UDP-N-acetylglucosamine O-acyltransferase [Vampirovibrionales bacterium]